MITHPCPPEPSDYDISLVRKEKFDQNIPSRQEKNQNVGHTESDGLCNVVACQIPDIACLSSLMPVPAWERPGPPWSLEHPMGHCCVMCEHRATA